ncbi:MAG: hypothetical protein K2G36_11340 [Ruminococcus sp.]|nr:hypothetical protein [Ruminococcus sp.]
MGLFDSFLGAVNEAGKKNYRNVTGNDYDRDFQDYLRKWEWKQDYELKQRWRDLEDDTSIRHAAEKAVVKELMKENGFDID